MSHSFLESCGLDKPPETEVCPTGFCGRLVQRGLCGHLDLQARPGCEMWFLVVPPLTLAQFRPSRETRWARGTQAQKLFLTSCLSNCDTHTKLS